MFVVKNFLKDKSCLYIFYILFLFQFAQCNLSNYQSCTEIVQNIIFTKMSLFLNSAKP